MWFSNNVKQNVTGHKVCIVRLSYSWYAALNECATFFFHSAFTSGAAQEFPLGSRGADVYEASGKWY